MKKIYSAAIHGLTTKKITIEIDTNKSLPGIEIVGLPDSSIKEAKERIRAACRNSGYSLPPRKILLNLAPSNIKKSGTRFDLPMALGVLLLEPEHNFPGKLLEKTMIFGELGLDGSVKPVPGLLPTILSAKKMGRKRFIVPKENYKELSLVSGIRVCTVKKFQELVAVSRLQRKLQREKVVKPSLKTTIGPPEKDFVKGYSFAKRGLTVAAVGVHNVLLIGPPGTGKTLLAKWVSKILPPLSYSKLLEVASIYSAAGKISFDDKNIFESIGNSRPFIEAHSSVSYGGLFGGGRDLKPGLISLAHRGVLFLDELPEFSSRLREGLRQPLQDKEIHISRYGGSVTYPCNCMVIATMNPCKCGYYGDIEKDCTCSENSIKSYQGRISGPLLERFDMVINITRQQVDKYLDNTSKYIDKKSVVAGWDFIKKLKNKGTRADGQDLTDISTNCKKTVKDIVNKHHFSTRVVYKLLNVAKTIANLSQEKDISSEHILEALHYRSMRLLI